MYIYIYIYLVCISYNIYIYIYILYAYHIHNMHTKYKYCAHIIHIQYAYNIILAALVHISYMDDNVYPVQICMPICMHTNIASCRHHKGRKWLGYLDGEGNVVHHDTKMTMQECLTSHINDLNNNVVDSSENVDSSSNFGISNIKEYNKPSMKNYKLSETLLVRAQMGMGKTRALRNYIDRHFSGNGKIIRFVTFRQTFSHSLQAVFPEFVSYKDIKGEIDARHPHTIVQVESLHRISVTDEPIDLLIIDESESILSQFSSGLHKHFSSSFATFKWMMNTAKHVVCMDANLGDCTYNTVQRMRPSPPILHWNKYSHAKDDKFHFTTNIGVWIGHLQNALYNGQKIVVPVNSLKDGKFIEEMIKELFNDKKVRLYSSETFPSEKKEHFSHVDHYWSDLDVLIYTPTVSAGVSFE